MQIKLGQFQGLNLLRKSLVDHESIHFIPHLPRQFGGRSPILLHILIVGVADSVSLRQHPLGRRSDIGGRRLPAALQQLHHGGIVDRRDIIWLCLRIPDYGLHAGNWRLGNGRHSKRPHPVIPGVEPGGVEAPHDPVQRGGEIVRTGQHIGTVQPLMGKLPGMGLTQDPAQNLLHVHLTGFIGKRRQNIGEGTIPALFQGVHGDDIADGAVLRHQVHVFQFIDGGRFDGDFTGGNADAHKPCPEFFKGGAVLLALGLSLEQDNGPDVRLLFPRLFLQRVPQVDSVRQHLLDPVPVVDDDRQLHHVLPFELHGVHIGDDVAFFPGRGGQVQHKAGVEIPQHLQAQLASGVVAFIHHNHGIQKADDLDQRRLVGVRQQEVRVLHPLGKARQIPVLLIRLAALLFAGTEGVVGQHHDGQLLHHVGGGELLSGQKLLLCVDLHPSAEIHLQLHPVGMPGIFEVLHRLLQNRIGGHQPHHRLSF